MDGIDVRVVVAYRKALRIGQCLLKLCGEFVETYENGSRKTGSVFIIGSDAKNSRLLGQLGGIQNQIGRAHV